VQRRRCHDERHRERGQHDGAEVQQLLRVRELLAESLVEDGDQLEAEQRLDARQHHAAFLEQVRGGGVE
jgi:hypothetical protein